MYSYCGTEAHIENMKFLVFMLTSRNFLFDFDFCFSTMLMKNVVYKCFSATYVCLF